MTDIEAVNRADMLLLTDEGEILTIDTMLDADGDETDDPEQAVVAMAELPDGRWLTVDLTAYEEVALQ